MSYRKTSDPYYRAIIHKAYMLRGSETIYVKCADKKEMRKLAYHLRSENHIAKGALRVHGRRLRILCREIGEFSVTLTAQDILSHKVVILKDGAETEVITPLKSLARLAEDKQTISNMIEDGFTKEEIEKVLGRHLTSDEEGLLPKVTE